MTAEDSDNTLGRVKAEVTGQASRLVDSVRDTAARQGDDLRTNLADRVEDLAESLRRAGSDGRPGSQTAGMFDKAAVTVSDLADSLGSADPQTMIEDVRSFARQQPGAFLGLSALAGFAAARFLCAGNPTASGAAPPASDDTVGGTMPVSSLTDPLKTVPNPIDGGSHA